MSGLLNTLEKIRAKPAMYLGKAAVSDLFMFLVGYEFARSEMGLELTAQEQRFYDEFQPWLQQKLGVRSMASWAKLIILSCPDEKTGFECFFNLIDEFWQNQNAAVDEKTPAA